MAMGSQEAFYVAWGSDVKKAIKSCGSLKKHNPDLKAILVCLEDVKDKIFDGRYVLGDVDLPEDKFQRKVFMIRSYLNSSNAEKVLYLDSDTEIFGNVQGVFDVLDRAELAMVLAPVPMINEGIPNAFNTYNTGVIGIRKDTFNIGETWLEVCQLEEDDQHAMRRLLFESGIDVAILPPNYNFRPKFPVRLNAVPVIVHGRSNSKGRLPKSIRYNRRQ